MIIVSCGRLILAMIIGPDNRHDKCRNCGL